MNTTRRTVLKGATASSILAGLIAAGALRPTQVLAADWNKAAFEAHETSGALKGLGAGAPAEHKDLMIKVPDIAENGAVVPIGVATTLAGVRQMLVLVEKNPNTLVASFDVTDAVDPSFSTRVKMGQSSDVFAVALTGDGKALFAKKEVKVTLGGCGG